MENISCCAATAVYRMLLFRHCSELLRGLEVTDARTLATLVDRLVRNADGSVYERNDLIILMAGDDPQAVDYRTLNAVLYQARRGIVILGDSNRLRANEDWRSFMSWANHNKFVMRIDL